MSHDPIDPNEVAPAAGRSGKGRKDYQRPEILFREPLEAIAAACTPSPPGKPDIVACASPQS